MNMQQNNISENNFEQCIKCTVCTGYCPVFLIGIIAKLVGILSGYSGESRVSRSEAGRSG